MAESTGETSRSQWSENEHYALLAKIPGSRRSFWATVGARTGGIVTSVGGGYVANRFGLHGAEIVGAAAPGFLLDVQVGLGLRIERVAASMFKRQKQLEVEWEERYSMPYIAYDHEPRHKWRRRFTALGAAATSNIVAFGTGAALAYTAAQEASHDTTGTIAGAVLSVAGFVATGFGEVATELSVEAADDVFADPSLVMHRTLFADGDTLYRRPLPSGPSPDS